jgi:Ca-activated chloride channel family protein
MRLIFLFIAIGLTSHLFAQEKVETEIKAENVFELSIIDIYPENYPEVSVVFQAKNNEGKPLWLLKPEEMEITENGAPCTITKLINITEEKPINIGLVFDHSGSMFWNNNYSEDSLKLMESSYYQGWGVPKWYKMPMDYGKEGVLEFISDSESTDSLLFVGFAEEVDLVSSISSDYSQIRTILNAIEPDGGTAFYDGLLRAIDSLSSHHSSSAIVALTDGADNTSKHSLFEVIERAQDKNIPVYVIGLGEIDEEPLRKLSRETNGFFYQTNDPKKLKEIYANIKGQLRSIYQVDYTSNSEDYTSVTRELHFSFLNDTLSFSNPKAKFELPEEAIIYIEKKEEERLQQIQDEKDAAFNELLLWGGAGAGVLLLGIGSFVLIRRQKVLLKIETLYPNPFRDQATVECMIDEKIGNAELSVFDLKGNSFGSFPVSTDQPTITIDTSRFTRGVYVFKLNGGGKSSKGVKAVKN